MKIVMVMLEEKRGILIVRYSACPFTQQSTSVVLNLNVMKNHLGRLFIEQIPGPKTSN